LVIESEIVPVKHDCDPPRTSPAHQLEAGRMAAVGQQYMRSNAIQTLFGQSKKSSEFFTIWRTLGAAGSRGHDRHADAVHGQVDRPYVPLTANRDRKSYAAVAGGLEPSLWHFAMTFATDLVVQRKTGDDAPVSIEEPSGNVVTDWGLMNPGELLAKAQVVQRIPFSTANVTNAQSIAPTKK
jgi:hypothetical protein